MFRTCPGMLQGTPASPSRELPAVPWSADGEMDRPYRIVKTLCTPVCSEESLHSGNRADEDLLYTTHGICITGSNHRHFEIVGQEQKSRWLRCPSLIFSTFRGASCGGDRFSGGNGRCGSLYITYTRPLSIATRAARLRSTALVCAHGSLGSLSQLLPHARQTAASEIHEERCADFGHVRVVALLACADALHGARHRLQASRF